jgi:hypothetical protein
MFLWRNSILLQLRTYPTGRAKCVPWAVILTTNKTHWALVETMNLDCLLNMLILCVKFIGYLKGLFALHQLLAFLTEVWPVFSWGIILVSSFYSWNTTLWFLMTVLEGANQTLSHFCDHIWGRYPDLSVSIYTDLGSSQLANGYLKRWTSMWTVNLVLLMFINHYQVCLSTTDGMRWMGPSAGNFKPLNPCIGRQPRFLLPN